ncbi:pyruvate formate lyase-activating protein [Streptomyces sp. MUM 203J]|uniref:pyruvate formate-lyase-activating protein n=1 Tax=Streptomyces sp. MUM 203J TaxID=2791990 RepID=UPI001F04B205|nr:pyruvate formate-lyase-activating protein [Streptomyces sp. MUM 203J]MCH0541613.1 pyruvate formate lyase-activating protein [Streptomyces sp. MUM 203J]
MPGRSSEAAVTGRVHSWDLSTGVDGPGTRYVLFTSGCPLRCLYCQNPDTWHLRDGRPAGVDEVAADIGRYRTFLTVAGGGVTVSGGEPLLQPRFTAGLFRRCKEMGLHTALDTSGYLGARADDALLADTDLVLLDIKAFDAAVYRGLTGGALAPTLSFATRLNRLGIATWIRYVLVPGWTDDMDAVDGLAAFAAGLDCVERVDVLPFHRLGAPKYEALGIPFPLRDTPAPSAELIARVTARFRAHGLRAD